MANSVNQTMAWVIASVIALLMFGGLLSFTSFLAEKNIQEKHSEKLSFPDDLEKAPAIKADAFEEKDLDVHTSDEEANPNAKKKVK